MAVWQKAFFEGHAHQVDGKVGPKTEACFNILHPRARVADAAVAIHKAGLILFDSWGNDARDNDLDGDTDGSPEKEGTDGSHFAGFYPKFNHVAQERCPNLASVEKRAFESRSHVSAAAPAREPGVHRTGDRDPPARSAAANSRAARARPVCCEHLQDAASERQRHGQRSRRASLGGGRAGISVADHEWSMASRCTRETNRRRRRGAPRLVTSPARDL